MLHPVAGVVNLTAFRYGGAMRYLLLLFLAGCASSAPRQYAQGIPVAPSAPAFNPVWDAPITTGQPGYIGPAENLPRSPHTRVLPETPATHREPGLWAGDQPRASIEPPDGFTVLDIVLPYVIDSELYAEREPTNRCGNRLYSAINKHDLESRLRALGKTRLQCLLMKAYARCADDVFKQTQRNNQPAKTFTERVRNVSASEARRACGEEPMPTDDAALVEVLAGGRP